MRVAPGRWQAIAARVNGLGLRDGRDFAELRALLGIDDARLELLLSARVPYDAAQLERVAGWLGVELGALLGDV